MTVRNTFYVLSIAAAVTFAACKNKSDKDSSTTTTSDTTSTAVTPPPVEVSSDSSLENGVRDATKDFPDVKAEVNNGEITLTGEISRDRLPTLIASLNRLQPKKINNNLTIK